MKIYTQIEYVWNGEEYVIADAKTEEYEGPVALCGGGGGGNTTSTVTQTNIPEYAQPYVESMLGAGMQQMFTTNQDADGNINITGFRPFVPFSQDPSKYYADFSPLEKQVQYNAANWQMPDQFTTGSNLASAAGQGALGTTGLASQYGNLGAQYGALGPQYGALGSQYGNLGSQFGAQGSQYGDLGSQFGNLGSQYGAQGAQYGAMGLGAVGTGQDVSDMATLMAYQQQGAGRDYARQATDPAAFQQYMSPYMENVVAMQQQDARRQADISKTQRNAAAARAGAFGGARQAIENAEAERWLQGQLGAIRSKGMQDAYSQALQNQQFGANLNLQGLQGAQSGLGNVLAGGQLGLQGIGTALSGVQSGIQGAQAGMQGAQTGIQGAQAGMQGAQTGIQGAQTGLQGAQTGMQGAQVGLQGVQGAQAGYQGANQAASMLGNLGTNQLNAQRDILNYQNQIGALQRQRQQDIINQQISTYQQQQQNPMQALNFLSGLLRGMPMSQATTQQYQAPQSMGNQIATLGLGAAGIGSLFGGGRAKGGVIKTRQKRGGDGLDTLGLYNAMKGKK